MGPAPSDQIWGTDICIVPARQQSFRNLYVRYLCASKTGYWWQLGGGQPNGSIVISLWQLEPKGCYVHIYRLRVRLFFVGAGPVSDEETQQGLEDSEAHKKKHDPIPNT